MSDGRVRVVVVTRREPLVDKVCPGCGAAFVGLTRQRYCGRSCANRADYRRHAAPRKEARVQRYRDRKAAQ